MAKHSSVTIIRPWPGQRPDAGLWLGCREGRSLRVLVQRRKEGCLTSEAATGPDGDGRPEVASRRLELVCSMFLWAWVSWGSFLPSSGVSCDTELHKSTHNIHIGTKLRFQNKVYSSPSFFILLFTGSVNHLLCSTSISRHWECTDV